MIPLIIGAAAVGMAGSYLANEQRKREAKAEKKRLVAMRDDKIGKLNRLTEYTKDQKGFLQTRQEISRSMLRLDMEDSSMKGTAGNRQLAMQASAAQGQAESALGSSGTTGGTAFYNLGTMIRDNNTVIGEQAQSSRNILDQGSLSGMMSGQQFKENNAGLDNQITEYGFDINSVNLDANFSIDALDKELDYMNSPLGLGMTLATGAMSGAQFGAQIESYLDSRNGVPQASKADGGTPIRTNDASNFFPTYGVDGFSLSGIGSDVLPSIQQPGWMNPSQSYKNPVELLWS